MIAFLVLHCSLCLPPQTPPVPQAPPIPHGPKLSTYETLLQRIRSGERVRVASGVPAPAGFESVEIPGETGLFECFEESGKPMMRPISRPMIQAVNVQRIVLQEACFT